MRAIFKTVSERADGEVMVLIDFVLNWNGKAFTVHGNKAMAERLGVPLKPIEVFDGERTEMVDPAVEPERYVRSLPRAMGGTYSPISVVED